MGGKSREGEGRGRNAACITRQISPACQLHHLSEKLLDPDLRAPDFTPHPTPFTTQLSHRSVQRECKRVYRERLSIQ